MIPTGGTIYGVTGVRDGYRTGRGSVEMRAKTHFEEYGKDGSRIAIDGLRTIWSYSATTEILSS